MITYTVPLFMLALIIGLAPMALDIYQVNAWNVGTVKTSPWARKAASFTRSLTSWFARLGSLLRTREAMALIALGVFLASPTAAHAFGLAIIGFAGELSMVEVKKALDESNNLFEGQFKDINGKIKALDAKGAAVDPILLEVREKLNKAIEDGAQLNETFMKQQAAIARLEKLGLGGPEGKDATEAQTRAFNLERRSWHQARGVQAPAEITQDEYKAYAEVFPKYLRVGEKGLTSDEQRAMSVGNDLNGGFLVTPDKTGAMVVKIYETSDVRRFASAQAIGTDALEGSADLDSASGGWVAELGSRTDSTTPNVPVPWRIPVHELYSQPKASQKLINDANVDIAAWLAGKVADKLARLQNTAFVVGNGVGQPRGFASYLGSTTTDATRAWGIPEYAYTGTSGGWGTDPNAITKLNGMMGLLKDTFVPNAQFFCNRLTKFSIRNLTDASSAGKFVFLPSFQAGAPDQVLGSPINVLQDMVSYTTADAYALAYGDMKQTYQIVDRQGISVLVDPFTSKPYVIFYTTARVGGDVINFEAMKFLKFGSS